MIVRTDRRAAAPHPGPILKREYLDPAGVGVATLAGQIGIEPSRLEAMLAGAMSFDVDASIRFARALQVSAERLMQMQLRFDFASARGDARYAQVAVMRPVAPQPFPEREFLRGRLGFASNHGADGSYVFKEDRRRDETDEDYAGLHALWVGDRLRVFGTDGARLWTGPILQNLDGTILLPFARTAEWRGWFEAAYAADLAFGPDHAAFFERMEHA